LNSTENLIQASAVQVVVPILIQVIAYLHRRGIVPRDLKPGNVLIDAKGQVKVLDFGLAAEIAQHKQELVGTVAYLVPEVLEGKLAASTPFDRLPGYVQFARRLQAIPAYGLGQLETRSACDEYLRGREYVPHSLEQTALSWYCRT
jgi:serine/threonine protein kinase